MFVMETNYVVCEVGNSFLDFFPPGATQPIVVVYFTAIYRALASSRKRLLDHTQGREEAKAR